MWLPYILTRKRLLRRLVQILFFPSIFAILALPQLTAEEPSPLFQPLRQFLIANGWLVLFIVVVSLVLVVWLTMELDFGYWLQKEGEAMKFNTRLLVDKQRGGNGLATGPLLYKWFLGWRTFVHVEPNEYCAVLDGEKKISKSRRLSKSPFEPATIKHVLLYPEPRQNITVQGIRSSDQWLVNLTVSIKYEVVDPVRVAGLPDPISELDQLIQGALIDYIGKHQAASFTGSEEQVKKVVLGVLQESETLRNFKIVEVLKAQAQPEQGAIEPIRDLGIEDKRRELAEKQAARKEVEALVDARTEEIKALGPFRRKLIELRLTQGPAIFQSVFDKFAAVAENSSASQGQLLETFDRLVTEFSGSMNVGETVYEPITMRQLPASEALSRRDREEYELERLISRSVINDYQLTVKGEQVRGAEVDLPSYTIKLSCLGNYPEKPPRVIVLDKHNQAYPIDDTPWQSGWYLADIIPFVVKEAPLLLGKGHQWK
jgi:hypothetical protein